MPQPSRTQKILLVVVALLAVAVIAAVFYRLGQDTPSTSPSPSGAPTTSPSGSSPSPAPGSPSTGSSTSGLPQGPARAGEGGHMTGPAGLPLGYDHTETGAVEAATNYLTWMNSIRIKDKNAADAMAEATAADEKTRNAMIESFDLLRTGLEDVADAKTEPARGAYAVAESGSSTASVYIWAPDWIDGDWKVNKALVSRVGGAAVDPVDPAGNPTPTEKASILSRTPADPGEIDDSAEQEWFEYGNAAR
jgi:cytoskeletal protein RodZ